MRHVAAYLLAALGGNDSPSASDIKAILSSVGVEADDASLKTVVDSLKGKVRTRLDQMQSCVTNYFNPFLCRLYSLPHAFV